jgi:integrase
VTGVGVAGLQDDFSTHVLRHTFGTNLVRDGHDPRPRRRTHGPHPTETNRGYALPTTTDRENPINPLPADR